MKNPASVRPWTRYPGWPTGNWRGFNTPAVSASPPIGPLIKLEQSLHGNVHQLDTQSPGAKEAAQRGEALMQRKTGQFNFACIDCHEKAANHWIRGNWLVERRDQAIHYPTWRTSRNEIWDLRKRFQWCGAGIRTNEPPPDVPEYGDMELALTALSNGLKMSVPGIRN